MINLWFTDQIGNIALPGYERIPEVLQAAGVMVKRDIEKVVGLGLGD